MPWMAMQYCKPGAGALPCRSGNAKVVFPSPPEARAKKGEERCVLVDGEELSRADHPRPGGKVVREEFDLSDEGFHLGSFR